MIDKQELRNKAYMAAYMCCGNTTTGGEYAGQVERICCGDPDETGDDVSIPGIELIALLDELAACKRIIDDVHLVSPGQPGCGDLSREQRTCADVARFVATDSKDG